MQAQTALPQLLPPPISFHYQPSPQLETHLDCKVLPWEDHTTLAPGLRTCSSWSLTLHSCAGVWGTPFSQLHTYLGIPLSISKHQEEQGQEHRNTGTWCLIFRSARYLQTLLQLIGATSPVHLEGQGQRRAAAQHIPGKAFACWNFFHILVWQVTRTECLKPWLWHTSSLAAIWEGPEDLTERLQSKNTFSCFIHSAGTSLKVFIHLFAAVQCRHWFQEHSRCEQGH